MSNYSNREIVEMKCADCGGLYKLIDGNTFRCPYCGSTKVILDSDAVQIAKARYEAYKEVELERIRKEHERLTPKEMTTGQKVFLLVWAIFMFTVIGASMYFAVKYLPN